MYEELNRELNTEFHVTEILDKPGLPIYLAIRNVYIAEAYEVRFALVDLSNENEIRIGRLKEQLIKYTDYFDMNAAYIVKDITRYQRDAFIKHNIPFISLPDHIYLPFLGIALQNHFRRNSITTIKRFTPIAQQLFLLLAYRQYSIPINKSDAAKNLMTTNTSITRAANQLRAAGLLIEEEHGRSTYLFRALHGQEYIDKASSYLINPVEKEVFVRPNSIIEQLPDAGESALSKISMLNMPAVQVKACRKSRELPEKLEYVDPLLQPDIAYIRLELWRYDPTLFTSDGHVDLISLYCSLRNETDERIEQEMINALEEYRWV